MWNFKGTLWNSTQNILLIHWKIRFLYNIGILRALKFKSSYAFLKRPLVTMLHMSRHVQHCRLLDSLESKLEQKIFLQELFVSWMAENWGCGTYIWHDWRYMLLCYLTKAWWCIWAICQWTETTSLNELSTWYVKFVGIDGVRTTCGPISDGKIGILKTHNQQWLRQIMACRLFVRPSHYLHHVLFSNQVTLSATKDEIRAPVGVTTFQVVARMWPHVGAPSLTITSRHSIWLNRPILTANEILRRIARCPSVSVWVRIARSPSVHVNGDNTLCISNQVPKRTTCSPPVKCKWR